MIVGDRAKIAADAEIGPYCVIDGEVEIGAGTVVESHARIGSRYGRVTIGATTTSSTAPCSAGRRKT